MSDNDKQTTTKNNNHAPRDILTPEEAADYLRICLNRVYLLSEAGKLPRIKIGKSVRFRRKTLEAWLERKEK